MIKRDDKMEWIKFIVCLFFGCFGVHKFMEKKKKLGFLFLFTIGLFGFGWLFDCCKYLILALKATTTKISGNKKSYSTISTYSSENHPVELPAVDVKMHIKNILLWIATIFFALIGFFFLIGGGTFAGIVAI